MTIQRVRAPTPGTTYNGFSDSTPLGRGPIDRIHVPPPPQRRYELRQVRRSGGSRRGLLLAGLGGVAALGVLLGVAAQPDLGWLQRATSTMPPPPTDPAPPTTEGSASPLPVEVADAPAPAQISTVETATPETSTSSAATPALKPALVRARPPQPAPVARPAQVALVPPARPQVNVATPGRLAEPTPAAARREIALPTVNTEVAAAPAPPAAVRPGFNCAAAHNVSTRMVCADAELASYDRQLNGAFARAVRAGVPRAELRADQDDWLRIREDAAHYSRQAVLNVYRQRISELNALARDPLSYAELAR